MLIRYFIAQLICMSTKGHILQLMELASDKSLGHFGMTEFQFIVFF